MKKTVILLAVAFAAAAGAGQLKIGWGKADVTPSGPTMLQGQKSNRLSTRIIDRLSVTALALEKDGTGVIMFSLDHCGLRTALLKAVRSSICKKIGVKPESIIGFVTHTHTAPKYGGIVPVKDSMKLKLADKKYETLGIGLRGVDIAEVKKQYPDFVEAFTRAVYRGQKWIEKTSADEIAKVIASQFPDSDEVLLTTVVERYRSIGAWKTEPTMTEAAYESLLTIIRAAGVIDEAPEFSSIVDNRFAQAVK